LMMSLWDALRMNMMISYQELVRTFLSEEGDCSMRFSTDGNLTLFDDFAVSPAFIYEYTKREKTADRTTFIPDTGYSGGGHDLWFRK
ncbi:hypothetical protein NG710_16370, partial [Klebsiella pneumoniae]|nr:hypothetical protein [Klebsiella pneumoniae]MCJ4346820.1 hypothetical protein [Klebsiella pneumoniae]MDQ6279665.1 hypothetical protein [Klebsiella pneumoniae]MDS6779656.1 hypothetical protein [Klebsiella pneumoniae]MDS6813113.1 hypothetical protein [Klebsiella pneumoniae]